VLASFLITYRETLEASLVIGVMLAYLYRTNNRQHNKYVYWGTVSAVFVSVISALLFQKLAGGFTGIAEEIFEGITMLVAAVLISFMILWMLNQKHIKQNIEHKVLKELQKKHLFGLFTISFISVLREGVETVIFLGAISFSASQIQHLVGASLGILIAIVFGFFLFYSAKKINLRAFFKITSFFLILLAAGLAAHGIHEFQEAGIIPYAVGEVWDINPAVNLDGSYPLLHEDGAVGGIFKTLLGYNGNPSLLEIVTYVSYFGLMIYLYRRMERKSDISFDQKPT